MAKHKFWSEPLTRPIIYAAVKARGRLPLEVPSAFIRKICLDREVKNNFLQNRLNLTVDLTCCRKKHAENSKQPAVCDARTV